MEKMDDVLRLGKDLVLQSSQIRMTVSAGLISAVRSAAMSQ